MELNTGHREAPGGSLELTLLKFLRKRDNFEAHYQGVPREGLDKYTITLLAVYAVFFAENPEADEASPEDLWAFMQLKYPDLLTERKAADRALLEALLKRSEGEVSPAVAKGIGRRLGELRAAVDSQALIEKYVAGEDVDLIGSLRAVVERIQPDVEGIPFVDDSFEDLLKAAENDEGIKWRLSCLNQAMRPMQRGDFGIIAARVDTGKTTLMCSELTFMAPQIEAYFGERRPILYFNCEGPGRRIKQRLMQASLGATMQELSDRQRAGEDVWASHIEALGGWEAIRVVDVHDRPLSFIEGIIRSVRPSVVVTDMLDVIPMDGGVHNGGSRTDQILEASYQRGRIWGVLYDCVHLAVSQLSADADGELYPRLTHLANSKTGKAGAADFVLMLGASQDATMESIRWVSLPKNKLARDGMKNPRQAVQFSGPRARLEDAQQL